MLQLALLLIVGPPAASPALIVKPYAQLGPSDGVTVMWHARPGSDWRIRVQGRTIEPPPPVRIDAPIVGSHDVYRAELAGLAPGKRMFYQLLQEGKVVFGGSAMVPKAASQPFSFAALGDIGRGTPGQRRIAYLLHREHPDFALLLGDLVYPNGRMNEYRQFLYPIWASEQVSADRGAPVLGNMLTVPATGNHDTAYRNLDTFPDGLAYYAYWNVPVNGPTLPQTIKGPAARIESLDKWSRGALRKMGNFTFKYGNASFVAIDSNHYVNWKDPDLRKWLDDALGEARKSKWSFLAMHAPPYSSSFKHAKDTYTRAITNLIDKHKVDVVFAGHVHNYQRTFPLTGFGDKPVPDRGFDGAADKTPQGTVYIVSGAGGAELYDQKQPSLPETWKPFTARFLAGYSFTRVDIDGGRLTLRQMGAGGKEIDRIEIQKP